MGLYNIRDLTYEALCHVHFVDKWLTNEVALLATRNCGTGLMNVMQQWLRVLSYNALCHC